MCIPGQLQVVEVEGRDAESLEAHGCLHAWVDPPVWHATHATRRGGPPRLGEPAAAPVQARTCARIRQGLAIAPLAEICSPVSGFRRKIDRRLRASRHNESRGQRTRRTAPDHRPADPRHPRIRNARLAKGLTQSRGRGRRRVDGVHLPDRGRPPPPGRPAAGADRGAAGHHARAAPPGRRPEPEGRGHAQPRLRRARAGVGRGGRGADPDRRGAGADRVRRTARAALAGAARAGARARGRTASSTRRSWRWRTWSPTAPAGRAWLASAIALSRCYRETGDLARAIETGERALAAARGVPAGRVRRGRAAGRHGRRRPLRARRRRARRTPVPPGHRAGRAARLAAGQGVGVLERQRDGVQPGRGRRRRLPGAEGAGPARAGQRHPQPRPAPDRSSGSASSGSTRRPSRTRRPTSSRPTRELEWSSASPIDAARNGIALARARYLAGDLAEAGERAAQIFESFRGSHPAWWPPTR